MRAAALLSLVLMGTGPAHAADALPDATAQQTLFSRGKQVSTATVHLSGGRTRSETTVGGQRMTTLMDRGAGKMWVLMPPPVGCIEQPLQASAQDPLTAMAADAATEELVGTETIDGHPTQKFKITTKSDGKPREHWQWRATDLGGFPIRTAAVDGSYEQRFTDVRLGTPDPKLFAPPSDCRPMPAMGGMTPPR